MREIKREKKYLFNCPNKAVLIQDWGFEGLLVQDCDQSHSAVSLGINQRLCSQEEHPGLHLYLLTHLNSNFLY